MPRPTRRATPLTLALALACLLALVPGAAHAAPARATTSACPSDSVLPAGLSDLDPASVHTPAVDCLVWWGITRGVAATRYEPAGTVTRGQMASFLARLLDRAGGDLPTAVPDRFPDDTGSVHATSVDRLAAAGIATGLPDGTFGVERPVTRGQMASFLARAAARLLDGPLPAGPDAFADDRGSAHEAAVNAVAAAGIAAGVAETRFQPDAPVRRDQMASFLTRTADLAVEGRLGIVSLSVAGLPDDAPAPQVSLVAGGATVRAAAGGGVLAVPPGTWTVSGAAVASGGTTWTAPPKSGAAVLGQVTPVGLLYGSAATGPVAPDVEALAGRDALAVTAYDAAAGQVRLVRAAAARVQPGEVLLAEPSPAAPDGLLLRVTDADPVGGQVAVTGAPATLLDVYPQGTAPLVVEPDSMTFTPEPGVTVRGAASADSGRSAQAVDVHVAGPTLDLHVDVTVGLDEPFPGGDRDRAWQPERGVFVTLEGPLAVTPAVRVKAGAVDAALGLEVRYDADLDVGVGASVSTSGDRKREILRKKLGQVRGGGCHAFVCATLEGALVASLSASGELRYDVELETDGRVLGGVRVGPSGQRPWVEGASTVDLAPVGAAGKGVVEVFAGLEGSVKLYGVLGPVFTGGVYGGPRAELFSDGRPPTCVLEGGARVAASLRADLRILGKGVQAFAETGRDFPLARTPCTVRQPVLPLPTLGLGGSLGDLPLLATEAEAVPYLVARLGRPDRDDTEQMCAGGVGPAGRTLVWGPLRVNVLDDLSAYDDLGLGSVEGPAVVGWDYHTVQSPDTLRLRTEEGIGLGSTLREVQEAYPDGNLFEELGLPTYEVFRGDLSNIAFVLEDDRVAAIISGSGCPE